jgi:LPXTG-motif cell wall-anchored protein
LGTTTPISGAATTVPGATTLPRTGSTSGYVVFFGLSCLAGGALLLRRRSWVR